MTELILVILLLVWLMLWVATYKPSNVLGLIKHTVVFALLSILLSRIALWWVFLSVDDTYSASNKGALGILYMMWQIVFLFDCLLAFGMTLKSLLDKKRKEI